MPQVSFLDAQGTTLPDNSTVAPAFSVYTIHIQKGIHYQPHPAFAQDKAGTYLYHHLAPNYLDDEGINRLSDFKHT